MKNYSFFFHYNKPASLQAGTNKLSIHFRDTCHIVDGVKCDVPIGSRNKKTQPRCVMTGKAKQLVLFVQHNKDGSESTIGHLI